MEVSMKRYGVIVGKSRVMSVYADNEDEAKEKAESQLDKPGRRRILKSWRQQGKRVREVE
jgi:hypothetical protein